MSKSLIDNWDFLMWGQGTERPFRGYVSSIDPTTAGIGVMIGGSKNVYKSLLGTIKNRSGLKRRGPADATDAGVKTSFEWQTTLGSTRIVRAANGKLQVEYDDGSDITYLDLLTGLSDAEMMFSFSPWWDDGDAKDRLIFVNGQQEINMWSGGVGVVESSTVNTIKLADTDNVQLLGFDATGSLIVDGVEYAYTGAGILENQIYFHNDTNLTPAISTTEWHAQLFTTSAAATGIVRALMNFQAVGISTENSIFTASIYTDNAGVPGTLVGTTEGTIPGAHSAGPHGVLFTFTDTPATPLTNYHLVVSLVSSGTTFTVYTGNTAAVGTLASNDSGSSWSAENGYLFAFIYENTVDGDTFTGVTPDPSGITPGSVAYQTVVTSTTTASDNPFSVAFGGNFTNDWIATIGNQLYVGCYNSRLVFESAYSDYLRYSVPVLRAPGDANVYTLDTNSRGATSKAGQKGNAVLFGSQGDSYSIVNTVETVQISTTRFAYIENQVIDKQTSSDLSSPLSQDFITSIGDTIIFFDESNQLRQFGTLRNLNTPVYPILSLDIYTELANLDPTGGALRSVSDETGETIYLVFPITGALYLYQVRNKIDAIGNLTAERIWQPPFIVGASRVAVIDAVVYLYSNSNPQMYQLWNTGQFYDDSPSDEEIPYDSHMILAYLSGTHRTQQIMFDKIYYEGYMTRGTNLYNNVYQEYGGSKNILTVTVNKAVNPGKKKARFYDPTQVPSLGDVALGQVPLGEGVLTSLSGQLPKFRAIRNATGTDLFEFALDVFSFEVNSQWEILCMGTNIQNTSRRATSLTITS